MPSLIFDTCCGCIELKTGCLIIGYLQLVGEIIYMIMGLVLLVTGGVVAANGDSAKSQESGMAVMIVAIILLLILFFFFAFTVVLLVGLHKDKRGHVKAYLIVAAICLVLSLITTLASFSGPVDTKMVVSRIISYIISVYFVLVIRSHYYKMDERKPAIYTTP